LGLIDLNLHGKKFTWSNERDNPTLIRLDIFLMLELIIINYNMYGLIYNKYILYNGLSNHIRYEVIKLCIINRV
jgi:hypothetical protein